MSKVTSNDGTEIDIAQSGDGPPVVLVSGGSVDRWSNAGLAALLADHFTVMNYDRRGRGASGDTMPYAVEREIEDIAAVIDAAGGSAGLYGSSSGAALAFEAAAAGLPVTKLALWEPPWMSREGDPFPPPDSAATYERLVAEGRRGDAVEYFMAEVVRLPPEFVAWARSEPFWAGQEAIAHTLAYDAYVMGDYSLPRERVAGVVTPTLVLSGGASPDWMTTTAKTVADLMPNGSHRDLEGQQHNVDAAVLAPALIEFFE
jgi:pimeloyl-ACP methyl ester carboxylesterase